MDTAFDASADSGRLRLSGEMTIYSAAMLKNDLIAAMEQCKSLEIDLSGVSEIDSAGMQILIAAKQWGSKTGMNLTLVGHSPAVLQLLELYNVGAFFGDPLVLTAQDASGEGETA